MELPENPQVSLEIQNLAAQQPKSREKEPPIIIKVLLEACPSLLKLANILTNEDLSYKHLPLAHGFCSELAGNVDNLDTFFRGNINSMVSKIIDFTNRIVLYRDDILEVRVHIYEKGKADETYIHDHQVRFISSCIQGSYEHKIHSIRQGEGIYYIVTRESGGIYSKEAKVKEMKGSPNIDLAQPFKAGQCLYLSEDATHTIVTTSSEQVVTITFRDLRPQLTKHSANIITLDPNFDSTQSKVQLSDNEKLSIFLEFLPVLRTYPLCLINLPDLPAAIRSLDNAIQVNNKLIQDLATKTFTQYEHVPKLKAFLCGIFLAAISLGLEMKSAKDAVLDIVLGLLSSLHISIHRRDISDLRTLDQKLNLFLRLTMNLDPAWFCAGLTIMAPPYEQLSKEFLKQYKILDGKMEEGAQSTLYHSLMTDFKEKTVEAMLDFIGDALNIYCCDVSVILSAVLKMRHSSSGETISLPARKR